MNLGRLHCESGVLHGTRRVSSLYSVCPFDAVIKHCFIILSTHSRNRFRASFFQMSWTQTSASSAQPKRSSRTLVSCVTLGRFSPGGQLCDHGAHLGVSPLSSIIVLCCCPLKIRRLVLCSFIVGNSGRLAQYQLSCRREAEKLIDRFVLTSGI